MTWSPLACGLITGKYSDGVPESSRAAMKVGWIPPALLWDGKAASGGIRSPLICAVLTRFSIFYLLLLEGIPVAEGASAQRGGPQAAREDQGAPSAGGPTGLHRRTVSHRYTTRTDTHTGVAVLLFD